tara:strand:+ start:19157 stop:19822 length:666 start_codon:yes stop_codon:yes gene_type:complete
MIETYKSKYNYKNYNINKIDGVRYYEIEANEFVPSVTSILNSTKPNSLTEHKKISHSSLDAMRIGNLMHKYLDDYISSETILQQTDKNFLIAESLAKIIIEHCINNIDEIWGTEASVHYKNRYAGTIDLIGVMNKNIILVDYKSSYRKKTQEEIDEYFLQLAAYTLAHDWQYKTKIDSIMIFLCMRNGDHEENTVSLDELKKYQIKWLERLNSFEDKNSNE